ncbi:MAG: ABC transporter permease, partial [Atopobium sp.]|nr:ABC transporter permease [Atopobium sp.]
MALFTSDKNSEKVQKTEAVLEDAAKAQEAEQAATGKVRAQSYWQVSWNIFKKNKLGMICLGIVLALAIIAILAPVIAPYSYKDQNLAIMNQ